MDLMFGGYKMTQQEKENEKLKLQYEGIMLEYNFIKELKNEKIEKQNKIINELKNEINIKEDINKDIEEQIQILKNEIETTKEKYECSMSWRITAPLRIMKKIVKRK